MKQLVIKTAVKTVIIILVLFAIATAVLNFGFPQHMATLFEKVGNYSMALRYSSQTYERTGDVADLARTFQNCVSYGNNAYIIEYGEELVSCEQFNELCQSKDNELKNGAYGEYTTSYKHYVCSNLSLSYAEENDLDKAVQTAKIPYDNASFPRDGAIVTLVIYAAENDKRDLADKIEIELNTIRQNLQENSEDVRVLDDLLEILREI